MNSVERLLAIVGMGYVGIFFFFFNNSLLVRVCRDRYIANPNFIIEPVPKHNFPPKYLEASRWLCKLIEEHKYRVVCSSCNMELVRWTPLVTRGSRARSISTIELAEAYQAPRIGGTQDNLFVSNLMISDPNSKILLSVPCV